MSVSYMSLLNTNSILRTALFFLLLLCLRTTAYAHDNMEYAVEVVRIDPSDAPDIDGRLDDAAWSKGKAITGFTRHEPVPGIPASERSEVIILYDDENLVRGS